MNLAHLDGKQSVPVTRTPIRSALSESIWSQAAARRRSRTAFILSICASMFIVLSATTSFGRPFGLDPSFGSNGKVATTFVTMADHTRRLNVQPDGKILVLATDSTNSIRVPNGSSIRRFLPNGSYDTTFAQAGALRYGLIRDFAILNDGRILAVIPSGVCRFSSNGMIDPSFGTNGCRSLSASTPFTMHRIQVQADGRIVVAGSTTDYSTMVARLLPNGSMDNSFGLFGAAFGSGGDMDYYVLGPWVLDKIGALEIQPDGKILYGFGLDWDNYIYIGRLNQDGSNDVGFGSSGLVSVAVPVPSYAYDGFAFGTAIQPDGKIVVTGTAMQWFGNDSNVTVARLRTDGSFDTDFGAGGSVSFVSTDSRGPASALIVLPNGKILLGGMDDEAFSLLRLNVNGSIDTRFGVNGVLQTPFGTSNLTSILAMQLQPDGNLIAAGSIMGPAQSATLGMVKYLNAESTAGNTPYDFDGDGKADHSVFRPSDTIWYLNRSTAGFAATQFGLSTDTVTPADFDGDGKTDVSVFRDGTWYWLSSSNGQFNARQFGQPADVPVPADYTGDGRADLAIFRGGVWWIQDVANGTVSSTTFGLATDKPVVADYDGDGRTDIAVFRSGEWHLQLSGSGYRVVRFGLAADIPLIGDFDGDGRADPAVYRQGVWYVQRSTDGYLEFAFGVSTDFPVPADYDGDGKTDAAIYRDGAWWVRQSSTQSPVITQFGTNGDKPLPFRAETH